MIYADKMKKSIHLFKTVLLIVSALSLVAGCNEKDHEMFTATIDGYSTPKDYIDGADGNVVFWNDGDMVKINNGDYAISLDEADRNRASIHAEGVTSYSGAYFAAYPASWASISADGTVSFTIPSEENYVTDSEGRQKVHSVMAAKADGGSHFEFHNLCSMLHFRIKSTASDARLCAIEVVSNKALCGEVTATCNGSEWTSTAPSVGDNTRRSLRFGTPVALGTTAKDFYLLVPKADDVTSFAVSYVFENSDGTVNVMKRANEGGSSTSLMQGYMYFFGELQYTGSSMEGYVLESGDGTSVNPYLVYSSRSWGSLMVNSVAGTANKYITLCNDIEVSGTYADFKAVLDGDGHTVTLTSANTPLFQRITNGTVRNLVVDASSTITAPPTGSDLGTLVCQIYTGGIIDNCVNKANINWSSGNTSGNVGGLIGIASGATITNCRNEGTIVSDVQNIGGVVGYSSSTAGFSNNINVGAVSYNTASQGSLQIRLGGVAGFCTGGDIAVVNCHNSGAIAVDGSSSFVNNGYGGVVGETSLNVENCSNSGTITVSSTSNYNKYVGGVLGYFNLTSPRTMLNCSNEGDVVVVGVVPNLYVGGLIGANIYMSVKNSYAFCDLAGTNAAGVVGDGSNMLNNVTIENCYYYGDIVATNVYGIAGMPYSAAACFNIDHCYYREGYVIRQGGYGTTTNNETIAVGTPLILGDSRRLADALNNNVSNMPVGSLGWGESGGHVVLSR